MAGRVMSELSFMLDDRDLKSTSSLNHWYYKTILLPAIENYEDEIPKQ